MDQTEEAIVGSVIERDWEDIALLQKDYAELMEYIPENSYLFVQLNKQRTLSDFYLEPNSTDSICIPDAGSYKQSLNLYMHKGKTGSGLFLLNKMPSKNALSMPDRAVSYGKDIYWWGIFDMGDIDLYLATRKMKKDIAVCSLSTEEMESAQKIIRLGRAIFIPESPYVLNVFNGNLTA